MQVFGYGGGQCGQSWLMQMDNPTPFTSFFTENTYEVSIGCNIWLIALPFGANGTPLSPNSNWQHWAITNSQTGIDFYINGNYAGGITTPISGTGVAGKKFFMGACPDTTGTVAYQDAYLTHWNGLLDDIGIWNRALTQQEITALYNGGATGIDEMTDGMPFSVFPNPTHDEINVRADERCVGMAFTLYDVYGKSVIAGQIEKAAFSLDVRNLAAGVYLLQPSDGSNRGIRIIKE